MPQVLRPQSTVVTSKDGEVKVAISLELTINLNSDSISVSNQSVVKKEESAEEEKTKWIVPDFSSKNKINFGKSE